MMESILIANRGEIARRIIRTARRLGVRSIAVYSDADLHAPFVKEADTALRLGAGPARDSYLAPAKILYAAAQSGAAGIHPGYGFLSENAEFAELVLAAGLVWVGAPPAAIRAMGRKDAAKALMMSANVPVTPGYLGTEQTAARLLQEADKIGYPVLIKAVAGGGGKGMRRVGEPAEFEKALAACCREAAAAFGDDRVLLEKYIGSPRHIEVQVFGDAHGQIVHLFERDCSLQRRHQKVIEEAPAPGMDDATRAYICGIATRAAAAVGYVGAGTVEFIADASEGLRPDRLWFMEMNTRLQVEHPVTEAITGEDLVEWQLRVANGERLPRTQADLRIHGWAMEARLYAENPSNGFLPSIGPLRHFKLPTELRVDCGVEAGGEVSGFYDPLIAKLIVHDSHREAAARRLSAACAEVQVWPVRTNAGFLSRITAAPDFLEGRVDTSFIERHTAALIPAKPAAGLIQAAARALLPERGSDPWASLHGFRSAAAPQLQVGVAIDDSSYVTSVDPALPALPLTTVDDSQILFWQGEFFRVGVPRSEGTGTLGGAVDGSLRSPMPGRIVNLSVRQGDRVHTGQGLLALEAMKMEHVIRAPFDGYIAELPVAAGDQVAENVLLVRIAPL